MEERPANQDLTTRRNAGDRLRAVSQPTTTGRLARVISGVVFVGLLIVLPLAVIPYGTVDMWWEATFECLIFVLTAVWLIGAALTGDWQIRRLSVVLPMLAITAYVYVQAAWWPPKWLVSSATQQMLSIDHYQTMLTSRKSLALTLFLALLLFHTSTPKRLRWVVRTVIGVGLATSLFGILRQFLQTSDATEGFILPFLFYGVGYGQFISANAFAYVPEMTVGLVAGLVLGGGVSRRHALIYLAAFLVVWTAMVLSGSRGALIGFACESIFILLVSFDWYSRRAAAGNESSTWWRNIIRGSKIVRITMVVLVLGTIGLGVLWMGGEKLAGKGERDATENQQSFDRATRLQIWTAGWRLFRHNPWTGTGFGTFFLGIPQFQTDAGRLRLEQAHNDYLDLAANGGVVGLALAAWFVATVVWLGKRTLAARKKYLRAAGLGAAGGIIAIATHSFFDFGLQLTGIAVLFSALIVILVADVSADGFEPTPSSSSRRRLQAATATLAPNL